jgi:hypothetical protein
MRLFRKSYLGFTSTLISIKLPKYIRVLLDDVCYVVANIMVDREA